jgi:hypothetical protein
MKLKTLRKKIRKLETRLQEGPEKLVRWKRKLAAMEKVEARNAQRKSAQAAEARQAAKASPPAQKKTGGSTAPRPVKAVDAPKNKPAGKAKRKLNLSPERRAQLAAAMKARWAAKRAAAEADLQPSPTVGDFKVHEVPQSS